ncbi:MAG: hypothetical protein WA419_08660 [Silvibacterium sp.]
MRRSLEIAFLLPAAFLFSLAYTAAAVHRPGPYVPLCSRQIVFSASYLAELKPGNGPGYLFRIENNTARPIRLAEPVPSSAHWYARVGNKWLWRASTGSGGSYVDAINERGPVFAYQPKTIPANPTYITVPAHGKYEWTAGDRGNAALAYRPGCEHCNYPGEREYKAVFAYAYLPPVEQHEEGLLPCGLRTALVDMPPKALIK